MMESSWVLPPAIALVALLYSSVGHGGASGYLAVMALAGLAKTTAVPGALILNLFVSSLAWWRFHREGHFKKEVVLPFLAGSVPLAIVGGYCRVSSGVYNVLLALALLCAAARMLWPLPSEKTASRPPFRRAILVGAILGFISGVVGVGGGIFLSPLLLFMGWAGTKETCAASAFFIFVNSLAALAGRLPSLTPELLVQSAGWSLPAVAGGLLGASFGAGRFTPPLLRRVLAAVLLLAAGKLFL